MFCRIGFLIITLILSLTAHGKVVRHQAPLTRREVPLIYLDGLTFKDLNRNGKLDPYEDWRLSPAERAKDLLGRMSLEEKAGTMLQDYLPQSTLLSLEALRPLVQEKFIGYFGSGVSGSPRSMAEMANSIQRLAEDTRLGIPVILSSDPRNHFTGAFGVGADAGRFSRWPDPLLLLH